MTPSLQLPLVFQHLQLPLLLLTNILALAVGPQHRFFQVGFSLPVWIVLVSQSLYRDYTGAWGIHYAVNCGVMSLAATYVDCVLLMSPDREGWVQLSRRAGKAKEGGEKVGVSNGSRAVQEDIFPTDNGSVVKNQRLPKSSDSKKSAAPTTFRSRLWWALRLACTNRYTGWSSEVKNVPVEVPNSYPRWRFIVRKSLRAALFYLAKDAIYAYTASSPHGSWVDVAPLKPAHSYTTYPLHHRFCFSWVHIVLTYISLELYNTLAGILSVLLGLARPSECPSAFGDLKGLYSVRRAWSNVWHQQCRRICSAPGVWIARDLLGLRKGSFGSRYVQLFTGFGVSGLVHGGASMLCHGSCDDDGAMKAFLAQAVVVFVEDHVVQLGKWVGLRDSLFCRFVGFVWTIVAVGASMEGWTGALLGHGLWVHDREVDWFGIGPKV